MSRWVLVALASLGMLRAAAAQEFVGASSFGSQEPLYRYDDQEKWKHGWMQDMPYYGGFHAFRPYNYHHVYSQATTAQGWGMSMPYSQQFWHRYENMTNLLAPAQDGYQMQGYPQQQQPYYQSPQMLPQQTFPIQPNMNMPQGGLQPIPQRQAGPQAMYPAHSWQQQMQPQFAPEASTIQTGFNPAPGSQQAQVLEYISGPALPASR
ncbi:MAG: hypothetical protein KDA69_09315 [Planctomycetaceae bacterium]|nr:hypothetical protein [Planctomycetaceae bacterium]MCA9044508.1 hypothetical protein [Planctomycetaceae bacterium]MCB9953920.1 hypothetical protein [Planctomycetaceae bacterium]